MGADLMIDAWVLVVVFVVVVLVLLVIVVFALTTLRDMTRVMAEAMGTNAKVTAQAVVDGAYGPHRDGAGIPSATSPPVALTGSREEMIAQATKAEAEGRPWYLPTPWNPDTAPAPDDDYGDPIRLDQPLDELPEGLMPRDHLPDEFVDLRDDSATRTVGIASGENPFVDLGIEREDA